MIRIRFTAVLFLAFATQAFAAGPKSFQARVIGIADGDTITVLNSDSVPQRIRLAGIDAPEKGQAFGDRSKQNLSRWVHDQTVTIEWTKTDQYGRLVAKVMIAPTTSCPATPCPATLDVNLEQIAAGFAWHYKQYENEQSNQDRAAYANAERIARVQKLGLWQDANPLPPWNKRHGPAEVPDSTGPVKKSRNNICHDPSMPTYGSVQKYTSYPSLAACVASGARLPREPL